MEWLQKIPLIRPLVALCLGILAGLWAETATPLDIWVLSSGFVFLLLLVLHTTNPSLFATFSGLLMLLLLFATGGAWVQMQNEASQKNHFEKLSETGDTLRIRVTEPPITKENSIEVQAEVSQVIGTNGIRPSKGNLLLYLPRGSKAKSLQYGDIILTTASYEALESNDNPYAFDYATYQFYNQTYHQQYSAEKEWMITGHNSNILFSLVYEVRQTLLSWQNQHIEGEEELKVANALLTGYREDLDGGLRDAYAASGAMHILAVSGLHTGLIFMVFYYLLSPLDRTRKGKLIKTLALVGILWFYACLTGLQPSVCRAATMLSFVTIGLQLNRLTNVFQSLTISAFILLLFNPYFIVEPGFQLSYAAVTGIVLLLPSSSPVRTDTLWGKALEKTLMLVLVSIAAQAFTAPFVLHYFGQFPLLFILTNLVALPFAAITLYSGFIFFLLKALSPPYLIELSAFVLNSSLDILNFWVFFIESLPGSPVTGISIEPATAGGLSITMLLLIGGFQLRKNKILIAGLGSLFAITLFSAYNILESRTQNKLYIIEENQKPILTFKNRDNASILKKGHSEEVFSDALNFSIKPMLEKYGSSLERIEERSSAFHKQDLWWDPPFGRVGPYKFLWLEESLPLENSPEVDFVMAANDNIDFAHMGRESLPAKTFIFDVTEKEALELCRRREISCHSLQNQGPFIKNW